MCELESILNLRPLSPVFAESTELGVLSPSHLLMIKPVVTSECVGSFDSSDVYSLKRWKYVQWLADLFWIRWRKEYLKTLLARSKWEKQEEQIKVGDLVLVANLVRNQWPLAIVKDVSPSGDGIVRRVTIKMSRTSATGAGVKRGETLLERPVNKLIPVLRVK